MSGHTPGPWIVHDREGLKLISANLDENGNERGGEPRNAGIYIAKVQGPDALPNACLIAAAPTLLEALETAAWLLKDISPDGLVLNKVNAAIELAKTGGAA